MAKRLCPSCGRPYNGKKCSHCLYENFTEEIAHGFHTHEGEPLVIEDAERRPIPTKDPFDCDRKSKNDHRPPRSRQTKKKTSVGRIFGILVTVMILLNAAFNLLSSLAARGVFSDSYGQAQAAPEGYDTVLFRPGQGASCAGGRHFPGHPQRHQSASGGMRRGHSGQRLSAA